MTKSLLVATALAACFVVVHPARGDNAKVENAIKNRADLSSFYQALVDTGVVHELNADTSYTVFAPTNDAFAMLTRDKYPCFYDMQCRSQIAEILRNHFVPGENYVSDAAQRKGGVYSIDHRFIPVGETSQNNYTVGGHSVTYMTGLGGSVLYKINGVIANERELAELTIAIPLRTTESVTHTIPDPACGAAGCPDRVTEVTSVRTMTTLQPTR